MQSFTVKLLLLFVLTINSVCVAKSFLPSSSANITKSSDDDPYRLSRDVLPLQYVLHLEPDLEDGTFVGQVEIEIEIQETTDVITLHMEGIQFEEVSVTPKENSELYLSENIVRVLSLREEHEMLDILLNQELHPKERYIIFIDYNGTLRDNMYGFYASYYYDSDGNKVKLAATHFQPTHARKAFPCFDEPSFKARFQINIITPSDYHSLSNMPIKEIITKDDNKNEYVFHNSLQMSTYIVAFVVSNFESQTSEENGLFEEVLFTTWARENALTGAEYSLSVARPMLKVLEDYTNIPYTDKTQEIPLNKVDMVALPEFSAGAMENWGLTTFRESALLYNGGSTEAKKRVATVVAHELLHMWFGNLITTHWWDTTWLNEGFARYFQYYVTAKVEEDWRMWDQFVVDQLHTAFASDSLTTSHALNHYVSSPQEARSRLSTISYNKGGSILRMISYSIGADNFQEALQNYLTTHKYDAVKPQNLFDALKPYAEATSLTEEEFEDFFQSWTEQPGYPVVNVERNYDSNIAVVSQKRFLFKGESNEEYYVPLTWTLGNSFEIWRPRVYLKPGSSLEISGISRSTWVIFNVQETGYYRVNYDHTNWKMIARDLNNLDNSIGIIHVLNRAHLLDDALNLARANQLPYAIAFELVDYIARETDYIPWFTALTGFQNLNNMLVNNVKFPVFKRYVLRLIDRLYEKYDFTVPESHDEKLLLNKLATWACALGHQKCLESAALTLRHYVEDDVEVPADLRSVVYCYGINNGNDDYWDHMWQEFKKSQDDTERVLLVGGLSCSSNENRLKELLEYSINEDYVRKQDGSSVFSSVYSNPRGVDIALDFLDENFSAISNYYGSMGSAVNNIVTGIASRLTTEDQKQKFDAFVFRHSEQLGSAGKTAQETVEENLLWINTHQEEIFETLEDKEMKQHRLPSWVTPVDYTLWLDPDISQGTFIGEVTINVIARANSDMIILHAEGLHISLITVSDTSIQIINDIYSRHSFDEHLEFLKIYLKIPLITGRAYRLKILFSGTLRNDMYGFYVSSYEDANGEKKQIAATQFQPTYARRAFPCFDEPSFKARFAIQLRSPPSYKAIGNMPTWYTRVWNNFTTEAVFYTTPLMSTYLVAFVVSDFEKIEDQGTDVVFRTWARSNALDWGKYSIEISRNLLEALEDYTGIKYKDSTLTNPFDKVDQVALPDFSAGAMENWGLITYRETALLYNDGTAAARKSVATIIAHELTHMWFGNLVTTNWWDATWLNEGFAQLFQFFATSKVLPDWRLMDQFLVDHHQGSFASDSLATSAALTADAYTPSQVSARFGTITYSKGASVLRMISSVMGEENFQTALHSYLDEFRYSTTVPDNLFDHFVQKSSAANLNSDEFRKFLSSWTEQPGFPFIKVDRNYNNGDATISQSRFLLKNPESPDKTSYYIPLTWAAPGDDFSIETPKAYLTQDDYLLSLTSMPEKDDWVIFNVQETGYYRVNYDDENWRLLTEYLKDNKKPLNGIHLLNRAQLLDDAFNLARASQLSYEIAFNLADYLRCETDFIPFASGLAAFSYLQRMLIHNDRYEHFEVYVRFLIEEQYNEFNFQDRDSHIEKLFLNRVSTWACSLQHSHCINAASTALQNFLDQRQFIPADLRSVVYCYGVRHSSDGYWYKLLEEYKSSLDNAERALLMAGLACTHNEEILSELLGYSIQGDFIRKQDASSVFSSVYSNSKGVGVALEFLDKNFNAVQEYYGSMGAINNIVLGIAGQLTTTDQRELLAQFVEKYSDSLGASGPAALETVDENLVWLEKHGESILNLLDGRELTTYCSATTPRALTVLLMLLVLLALRMF